ncbi:hypothetical protein CTI14_15025 [Methylobacterium radiotolerans]|nr:hypothetical protein CTI14_15025 [Methylobacterium radiotolerans]
MTRSAQIAIACAVAAGTKSGDVVLVAPKASSAWRSPTAATAATITAGTAAPRPHRRAGQRRTRRVSTAVRVTVAEQVALGEGVYRKASDGTYTTADAGNQFIGYALEATSAARPSFRSASPAP